MYFLNGMWVFHDSFFSPASAIFSLEVSSLLTKMCMMGRNIEFLMVCMLSFKIRFYIFPWPWFPIEISSLLMKVCMMVIMF